MKNKFINNETITLKYFFDDYAEGVRLDPGEFCKFLKLSFNGYELEASPLELNDKFTKQIFDNVPSGLWFDCVDNKLIKEGTINDVEDVAKNIFKLSDDDYGSGYFAEITTNSVDTLTLTNPYSGETLVLNLRKNKGDSKVKMHIDNIHWNNTGCSFIILVWIKNYQIIAPNNIDILE